MSNDDATRRMWQELKALHSTAGDEQVLGVPPYQTVRGQGLRPTREADDGVHWMLMDAVDRLVWSYERIGYNKGWAAASVKAFEQRATRRQQSRWDLTMGLAIGFLSGFALAALLVNLGLWR